MLASQLPLACIRRPHGLRIGLTHRSTPGSTAERPDVRARCDRMHVPSDSFNGRSPEKHAALMLENLFTFAACKIALAQMQGDGRGDLGSFGGSQYVVLKEFMGENPLGGGVNAEEWLEKLLRVDRGLGLRIIETRYAYASKDYEWDQMRRVALSNMETGNIGVLRSMLEREVFDEDGA